MNTNEKELNPVNIWGLTYVECSQFIDRQVAEIEAIDPTLSTDQVMIELLSILKNTGTAFHNAILQVQKSAYTEKLIEFDDLRDKSMKRYEHALKNFCYSNNNDELEAYKKLKILSSIFKNVQTLNYEAETKELAKLFEAWESAEYSSEITKLNLGGLIDEVKTAQNQFIAFFNTRSIELSSKNTIKIVPLRKTLLKQYTQFTEYVLALANALDKEPYNSALKLLNTTRSYYDELIKKREGTAEAQKLSSSTTETT